MKLRISILLTLLAAAMAAQRIITPPPTRFEAPVLLHKAEPQYSVEARQARLEGVVVVYGAIGADGHPQNLHVVKSLGLGLDEKALEAVSQWIFAPSTREGTPVSVQSNLEVSFRMPLDDRDWRLAGATFTVPHGATQPVPRTISFPSPKGAPENASVRVSFEVDEQGIPANIQVEDSSDPKWNDEVIALIREWRFQAALNNGIAVPSRGLFDFSHGEPFNLGPLKKEVPLFAVPRPKQ